MALAVDAWRGLAGGPKVKRLQDDFLFEPADSGRPCAKLGTGMGLVQRSPGWARQGERHQGSSFSPSLCGGLEASNVTRSDCEAC